MRTAFDFAVHEELRGHEARRHDHPWSQPCEEAPETCFAGQSRQSVHHRALGPVAFVDLAEKRICRLQASQSYE
jgi:hypothetical protein